MHLLRSNGATSVFPEGPLQRRHNLQYVARGRGEREREVELHALPYAAWAAVVSLVSSVAPGSAPADLPACEAPRCVPIGHAIIMTSPLAAVGAGMSVEWRIGSGLHWIVESGTTGGCLAFELGPSSPAYRVKLVESDGILYGVHEFPDGRTRGIPCANATRLPNDAWALSYRCALHAREGGVGLLLVLPDAGIGPPVGTLP